MPPGTRPQRKGAHGAKSPDIASNGAEAGTVYHYDISVYEENTLEPLTTDSFYIQDASGSGYLRNTDGRFVDYDESNDLNYLWQIRRLPSSYGNRYMLISRANSRQHLDENGALTTATGARSPQAIAAPV